MANNTELDKGVEKIRDFITPPSIQFGGAYLGPTNFDFNCSNEYDESDNCYNLKLDSKDQVQYVLDKLIGATSAESKDDLITRFIENSECDKSKEFFLQFYRRF